MNAVARAELTFQMLILFQKNLYSHQSQYQKMGQQRSGPDSK